MKPGKFELLRKFHCVSELKYEEQTLASFLGLVLHQLLFIKLTLKSRLRQCSHHLPGKLQYGFMVIFLMLTLHSLLGYRYLRQQACYRDGPLVKRIFGVMQLSDVATVSCTLAQFDEVSNNKRQGLLRNRVLDRIRSLSVTHLTLDFDGTVIDCGRLLRPQDG